MSDPERIITSVSTLFRALSHLIRGDLSVISNDLSFLATLVPEGEVERAKNRCNSIISTLHSLQFLKDSHFKPVETSVYSLFQDVCPGIEMTPQDERFVTVDSGLTRSILSHLISIFLQEKDNPPHFHPINEAGAENTYWVGTVPYKSNNAFELPTLDLLSGATKILGESSIPKVAVCELILVAQGVSCHVNFSSELKKTVALKFTFPHDRN